MLDEAGQLVIYGAKRQQAERRAWLRNAPFTVCLARPAMVTWAGDDDGDRVLSAVGAWTSGMIFYLEQPMVGADDEIRRHWRAVRTCPQVGGVALDPPASALALASRSRSPGR